MNVAPGHTAPHRAPLQMELSATSPAKPWRWIPTLYFSQGIPYVAAMTLSVILYKNLGVSNTDIALYTSWLYLPWVIKPLWSPIVDLFRTKRWWIVTLQFLLGAAFAAVALTVPGPAFFRATLAVFWLIAFSSATHDIAADGFYLLALPNHQQAAFVGVRSTFYRLAMIAGQGGLVWLAGSLTESTGNVVQAWTLVFGGLAVMFVLVACYHWFALPKPAVDHAVRETNFGRGYFSTFGSFFRKPGIGVMLGYLLLYRFAESQLLKLATPFLLDPREAGGLGLSTQQVGIYYGTIGVIALTVGGLIGGYVVSRVGLKRLLWPRSEEHACAQCGVCFIGSRPTRKSRPRRRGGGRGTTRLWVRVHRLHALHDVYRPGRTPDSPLCDLHRFHGAGYDAARHGRRLDSGTTRLC